MMDDEEEEDEGIIQEDYEQQYSHDIQAIK
jgi:hypothetical protein